MSHKQINHLANNINKVTPTPNKDAQSITAIVKKSGEIVGYQLSNGKVISKEEGLALARQGQIKGIAIAENQGTEYLRSLPDETEGNNLASLPVISE